MLVVYTHAMLGGNEMAIVKTTLSLTDLDRQWMDSIIAKGEYVSSSEYVRNLIRRDKEYRAKQEVIRAQLIKAEQSGIIHQTRAEMLAEFKDELRRDGNV